MSDRPHWYGSIDVRLLRRLMRPVVKAGTIDVDFAYKTLDRWQTFLDRRSQFVDRHQITIDDRPENSLPVVSAQPIVTDSRSPQVIERWYPAVRIHLDINLTSVDRYLSYTQVTPESQGDRATGEVSPTSRSRSDDDRIQKLPVVSPLSVQGRSRQRTDEPIARSRSDKDTHFQNSSNIRKLVGRGKRRLPNPKCTTVFGKWDDRTLPIVTVGDRDGTVSPLPAVKSEPLTDKTDVSAIDTRETKESHSICDRVAPIVVPISRTHPTDGKPDVDRPTPSVAAFSENRITVDDRDRNPQTLPVVPLIPPPPSPTPQLILSHPMTVVKPSSSSSRDLYMRSTQPIPASPSKTGSHREATPTLIREIAPVKIDIDALVDRVERKLMRKLVVERERRGKFQWR